MDDQEKMDLAFRHCQRIYPKIRKLEAILTRWKIEHKRWATLYENIQLKHAHVERIVAKVAEKRISPATFKRQYDALDEEHKRLLIKALNGSLEL